MFRNQYDNDVTTWSPQGRLHQVEYAMEAVKQGSTAIGLKNKDSFAVLVALKRTFHELASYQKKLIHIDDHVGAAIAGLTADGRILTRYMRNECLNERYARDEPILMNRLMVDMGNKMQGSTQRYDRRPYGVGLIVAGFDQNGPHIYQTCPSANYFNCKAMAIGARSQSARTYLEKHLDTFLACGRDELVKHGLLALRECLPNDTQLTSQNVSIGIVGKDFPFKIYEENEVDTFLKQLTEAERKGRSTQPPPPPPHGPSAADQPPRAGESMDVDDVPRPADPATIPPQ
ncbi:PREDICTED: proteasome subunit alpha type-1-like [Rhagoletis zephyria]|uniref:proteasome subunit alpha type-1-like n=1 Tax=Rhagoletis zephyria TaxID=28612 RepID=UPI0008113DD8|nr:PREDICTED: proteasome subunit alpha type-1-like [Rhagoletis zephyria]KAH9387677.1 Proteasome subunit alpha 1 [Tyrophagus putrescentiae]